MDPTTALQLAQYRMAELQAEASARRLAAQGRGGGRRLGGHRPAAIAAAVRSMPARLRDIARIATPEPDVQRR